jgi:uncharacterized membrane protein YsdA (DUF1294 family)
MKPLWLIIICILVLTNLFSFFLMGADKRRARKGKRRVPERTLLLLSFLGGCVGALCGMVFCRHKTKHAKFLVLVPLSVLLWALGLGALLGHLLGWF